MSEVMIKAQSLSKTYKIYDNNLDRLKEAINPSRRAYHREFSALSRVDLEIRRGEAVGIVGRNGSGKSTLLKILAGVVRPSSGTYRLNGQLSALLELGTGFNPEHTGLENIFLAGRLKGILRAEMQKRADSIIEFAGIGEFINQRVKTYSSGMFARLAFAVAINSDPDILIVDEALSVGDVIFRRKCAARLQEFRDQGKTILIVSHSESAIMEMCNRAILIDAGEKLLEGTPKEVLANYLQLTSADKNRYRELRAKLQAKEANPEEPQTKPKSSPPKPGVDESFIPGLVSESMTAYTSKGAMIENVRLENAQGERVNRLAHGERYRFSYDVFFVADALSVSFGMLIKTVQGLALCGGSYPRPNQVLALVNAGERVSVAWEFDCLLEEGTYFMNCSVSGSTDGGHDYLHRLLDVQVFQVAPREGKITTSYVNLGLTAEVSRTA